MSLFKKIFGSSPVPSPEIAREMDLGKYFYLFDYYKHYAEFLTDHPAKQRAVAELFIFRAWTTHAYFQVFSSRKDISDRITYEVWNLANTLGRAMLNMAHEIDIEAILGGPYLTIADLRWQDYTKIFLLYADSTDSTGPFNLCAKAADLSGKRNDPVKLVWLTTDFVRHIAQIKAEAIQRRILT